MTIDPTAEEEMNTNEFGKKRPSVADLGYLKTVVNTFTQHVRCYDSDPTFKASMDIILQVLNHYADIAALIDKMPGNLYFVAPDGELMILNSTAIDALRGRTQKRQFAVETLAALEKNNKMVLTTPGDHVFIEEDHQAGDFYFSSKKRVVNDQGEIIGLIGQSIKFNDTRQYIHGILSEKKHAEQVLEERELFVQKLFHDLRSPLGGFDYLFDCIRNSEDIDTIRKNVALMESNFYHHRLFLDNLMEKTVQSELNRDWFSFKKMIDSVVELFEPSASMKHLTLNLKNECLGEDELIVYSDIAYCKRILVNLISNAIKFTETGNITIKYGTFETEGIYFTIIDTGIGVPEDELGMIFDRFYRVEKVSGRYAGSGLGLSIVKSFTDVLGGGVLLDNNDEGGCYVHVTIPTSFRLDSPDSGQDVMEDLEVLDKLFSRIERNSLKFLLIEDDHLSRLACKNLLNKVFPECQIVSAKSEKEAFAVCQLDQNFTAAFIDLGLPDSVGDEQAFLARLKKLLGKHTFTIVLSAHITEYLKTRCLAVGIDLVHAKPMTLITLEKEMRYPIIKRLLASKK